MEWNGLSRHQKCRFSGKLASTWDLAIRK